MSIPNMGRTIAPPPRQNKNKLWERYSKGEVLKPSYNIIEIKSKVPLPPPTILKSKFVTQKSGSIVYLYLMVIVFIVIAISIFLK